MLFHFCIPQILCMYCSLHRKPWFTAQDIILVYILRGGQHCKSFTPAGIVRSQFINLVTSHAYSVLGKWVTTQKKTSPFWMHPGHKENRYWKTTLTQYCFECTRLTLMIDKIFASSVLNLSMSPLFPHFILICTKHINSTCYNFSTYNLPFPSS